MNEIKTIGDLFIVAELERVRFLARVCGQLPAFRRGRMYLDFDTGKIRVAPIEGDAA